MKYLTVYCNVHRWQEVTQRYLGTGNGIDESLGSVGRECVVNDLVS